VANLFAVQVEDSPQHLVDVALEFDGGWGRGQFEPLIEIVLVGFHRDIEVLRFGLLADEGTVDFNHERTVQGLDDLQLSRLVPAVLLHPFYRNDLVTVADAGSEDAAESAASNQILHNKIAFSEFFLFLASIQRCCVMGTLPAKGMTVVQTECF
jgi:hypothetical protein